MDNKARSISGEPFLTIEQILVAAEEALRRFGPAKTTVVDVARALGVSHGTVYRHFASKADLRSAVVQRWLDASLAPLSAIANEDGPAIARLRHWLDTLVAIKRKRAAGDPELFAAYFALALESGAVVQEHMADLRAQVARIVADGVASGEMAADDPEETAGAILGATVKFQNPAHAGTWTNPDIDIAYEQVWRLILRGLAARTEENE